MSNWTVIGWKFADGFRLFMCTATVFPSAMWHHRFTHNTWARASYRVSNDKLIIWFLNFWHQCVLKYIHQAVTREFLALVADAGSAFAAGQSTLRNHITTKVYKLVIKTWLIHHYQHRKGVPNNISIFSSSAIPFWMPTHWSYTLTSVQIQLLL